MIKVTYQNEVKEFDNNITYYEVSKQFGVTHAMVALVNFELVSLSDKITSDVTVDFLDIRNVTGYKIYQAALKYMFLVAVDELFSNSKVKFLHSVPKGILCEVKIGRKITEEDISKIKEKMAELVNAKEPFLSYHLKPIDAFNYYMQIH